MKPYPKYKDSGVEWIGNIPSNWTIAPLRRFLSKIGSGVTPKGGAEVYQESGVPLFRSQNVHFGGLRLEDVAFISENIHKDMHSTEVNPDDVLINITGASIGRCCVVPSSISKANVNQHVCILRCGESIKPRLLNYFLMSEIGQVQVWLGQTGAAREGLTYGEIGRFAMILPESAEQDSIIRFLDAKTAQIDELIEKKRRQIELLREYRASVISEAVTKGLNPNVRMKDSGVEWIGQIPEHWVLCKIKHVADAVKTGSTPPSQEEAYFGGDFDWFTPGDFEGLLILRNSSRKITEKAVEDDMVRVFPPFSVLLVGIGATLGKIGITEVDSSANQQINAVVFQKDYASFFGAYFLTAFSDVIMAMADAATLPIFNQTATKNFPILRPPIEEQRAIVQRLQETDFKIEQTSKTLQQQIESLQSYRTSLISEAVTGKIDVRDWAKAG